MKKELIKLLETEEMQNRVGGLLVAKGYAKKINHTKGFKYSNLELTKDGSSEIGKSEKIDISDEWLDNFRSLFPEGRKGNKAIIKEKAQRFMIENECSLEDIQAALTRYIRVTDPQYVCRANNFFYKKEPGQEEESYCEEFLRTDNSDIVEDYRHKLA